MQTRPYKHPHEFKEVVNIRTAGAASKRSAANAIHIRIHIRPNDSQNYSYSAEESKTTIRYFPKNNMTQLRHIYMTHFVVQW